MLLVQFLLALISTDTASVMRQFVLSLCRLVGQRLEIAATSARVSQHYHVLLVVHNQVLARASCFNRSHCLARRVEVVVEEFRAGGRLAGDSGWGHATTDLLLIFFDEGCDSRTVLIHSCVELHRVLGADQVALPVRWLLVAATDRVMAV